MPNPNTRQRDARQERYVNARLRQRLGQPEAGWRQRWYTIIFEADTRQGACSTSCC